MYRAPFGSIHWILPFEISIAPFNESEGGTRASPIGGTEACFKLLSRLLSIADALDYRFRFLAIWVPMKSKKAPRSFLNGPSFVG